MAARSSSPSAIEAVDQLLDGAGLKHGRRQLMGAGFERQARHPGQASASRAVQARVPKAQVEVMTVPAFSGIGWLLHGFSTRAGGLTRAYRPEQTAGELNLGFSASDEAANVIRNRQRFAAAVTGDPDFRTVTLRQIHSSVVRLAGAADAQADATAKADGLMTGEAGVLLAIQTADCVPVLLVDRKRRAVAGFHAGWRGTLKRIVESGVGRMRMEFGSHPEDLVAAIGPGIGQCCYSVGEEVRDEFGSQFRYADELFREVYDSDPVREKYPLLFLTARAPGHSNLGPSLHLDLVEANRRQLVAAGLAEDAISVVGECTSCRTDRYFSYRAEHGFTGRMFSVVGMKE